MNAPVLTRRKHQLALLEEACARRVAARLARRGAAGSVGTPNTRLLAVDAAAGWLEWPAAPLSDAEHRGVDVDVVFEVDERRYGFPAETRGRFERSFGEEACVAVKLSLPVRVESRERRAAFRVTLDPAQAVEATLVRVSDRAVVGRVRVCDVSVGGFGGLLEAEVAGTLDRQALYWAEFRGTPGGPVRDLVVRLAHMGPAGADGQVPTGWAVCPGEGDVEEATGLQRLCAAAEFRRGR